jgi:hypothetical protein
LGGALPTWLRKSVSSFASWIVLAVLLAGSLAAKAQITIMPMGDSITVGVDYYTDSLGGYRDRLYRDLTGAGVSFTFVGAADTSPTPALTGAGDTYHNGFGGWTIDDINNNLAGVAAPEYGGDSNQGGYLLTGGNGTGRPAMTPNIILLHIGTNDLLHGSSTINQDLYNLVTHIHALTPNTTILIAGIIPINSSGFSAAVLSYNTYISSTLVPSLSYTRYVNQYSSFLNTNGTVNGALIGTDLVHPDMFGYPLMALNWAAAIESLQGVHPTTYPLTVNDGTGSGSYPAGSIVTLQAQSAAAGSQFGWWTPENQALSNPFSPMATYTMPNAASSVSATYDTAGSPVIPNGTYQILSYYSGLTIGAAANTSGSAVEQLTPAQAATQEWDLVNLGSNTVTLMLTGTNMALEVPPASSGTLGAMLDVEGYVGTTNQQWTIEPGAGTIEIINLASGLAINITGYSTSAGTQLGQYTSGTCNDNWDFFPVSTQPTQYPLTVVNGTGGGSFAAGTTVTVSANPPATGYLFTGWTGATSGMSNPSAESTTIVTTASAETVTATYAQATYPLTVSDGSGSGSYTAGTAVTITANAAPAGYQFAGWTGATSAIANPSAATTVLTMPAAGASVTATYSQISSSGSSPTIVSVQIVGGGAAPLDGSGFNYTAGAGTYAAAHWNSVLAIGNTTSPQNLTVSGGLTTSTGAASGLGFTLTSDGAYYTGAGTGFTNSPPYPGYPGDLSGPGDAFLYAGFAYTGYSGSSPVTLTLTGLNASHTYSMVAYVAPFEGFGDSQSAMVALVGGSTYYLTTAGKLGSYVRASSQSASSPSQANYVEFDNVSGSATQELTLAGSTMVGLSGFQVIDNGAGAGTPQTETLTVVNGSGSGTYAVGAGVSVTANAPASGYTFSGWSGSTAILANPSAATTTATIPASASTITANYTSIGTGGTASSIVGVQFVGGGASPLYNAVYNFNYTAGAGNYAASHWNSVLATGNTQTPQSLTVQSGLFDSTGAATNIGFTIQSSGAYYTGAGTGFTTTPPYPGYPGQTSGPGDAFLFAGFGYAGFSNGNPVTLTVTGLNAAHTYSLLVYVAPFESFGDGQSASVALSGGATYYLITCGKLGSYQRALSTLASAPATANYAEFDGVTGSATQMITFTNTSSLVGVSGFQVVDTTSSTTASTVTNSSTVPAGYQLTFDDEFTSLNISDVSGVPANWYSQTIQCCMYDTSNPSTPTYMAGITWPAGEDPFSLASGGGLDVRLQKTNGAWYSGVLATVDSHGHGFAQQYGYFEMKANFPNAPGTWPAFWLLNQAALTSGANAGEIDVVESYMQFPNYINTTLHDWTPPASTPAYNLAEVANLSQGFHIFGMLWTASTMTFYCDGATIFTTPTPAIMNQPYYPIIDLGLGGGWPTNQTPNQSDMIVQYVRVYAAA